MKKYLILSSIIGLAIGVGLLDAQQQSGTPNQIRVLLDANGYLVVSTAAQTLPLSQPSVFTNTRLTTDSSGNLLVTDGSGAGFAPANATYITQTANASLSAEQAIGALSSGILAGTTTTGVISSLTTSAGIFSNISDETGGTGVLVGSISPVFGTTIELDRNAIAVTSTDGVIVANTSAAAVGAQQWSPRLRFRGNGWGTGGGASQTLDSAFELQTTQGSNPSFDLVYKTSLNGAAYVNQYDLLTSATGVPSLFMGTGGNIWSGSTGILGFNSQSRLSSPADSQLNIANNANSAGIGFDVSTDSTLKIRTRAQSGYGTIDILGLKSSGSAGASCTITALTGLTVVNGIVTACTGT